MICQDRFLDPATDLPGTVLILAPHMDDEVLACGGTVARMRQPDRVHVAYASDGSASPAPPAPWIGRRPRELTAARMAEAREAMAELGVPAENLHFFGLPDGRLWRRRAELTRRIEDLVGSLRPAWLFLPFRYDRHPDHLAVTRGAASALGPPGREGPAWLEYFVYWRWRLLPGGDVREYVWPEKLVCVEVAPAEATKRRALGRFRSQTTRYYPWQTRPNLQPELVDEVCRAPEVFHRLAPGDRSEGGRSLFRRRATWIRLVHRLELPLKREKDRALALWRLALGRGGIPGSSG